MERSNLTAQSIEDIAIPSKELVRDQDELVPAITELRWADLVALDELQGGELKKLGVRPARSEIIRRAIQFYYEKHQEVII